MTAAAGRKAHFRKLDGAWQIEEAVLALLAGTGAEKRCQAALLSYMPSFVLHVPIATAVTNVTTLRHSNAMKMAPAGLQGCLETIHTMLLAISQDRCPSVLAASSTPLARTIFARFGFFLRAKTDAGEVLSAEAAMKHIVESFLGGSNDPEHIPGQ